MINTRAPRKHKPVTTANTSGGYGLVILNPRGVWTAVSLLLKVFSGGPLLSAAPCCRSSLPCLSRVHQCTRFRSPSLPDSHSPPSSPPLPDLKSLPGQAGLRFGRWVLQRLVPFHSPIWPRAPFPQEAPKRSASTSFQYGLLTRSQMQAGKLRPIIGSQSWPRSHTCSA